MFLGLWPVAACAWGVERRSNPQRNDGEGRGIARSLGTGPTPRFIPEGLSGYRGHDSKRKPHATVTNGYIPSNTLLQSVRWSGTCPGQAGLPDMEHGGQVVLGQRPVSSRVDRVLAEIMDRESGWPAGQTPLLDRRDPSLWRDVPRSLRSGRGGPDIRPPAESTGQCKKRYWHDEGMARKGAGAGRPVQKQRSSGGRSGGGGDGPEMDAGVEGAGSDGGMEEDREDEDWRVERKEGGEVAREAGEAGEVEEAEEGIGETVVYPPFELLELSTAEMGLMQQDPDVDSAQFFVTPPQLATISDSTWSYYPGREKREKQRQVAAAGFPCVILTSPWVVRIPLDYQVVYLERLRAVHHIPHPGSQSDYSVTDKFYTIDSAQLVEALGELPLVLVEGYGMKLSVVTAVPKYDRYRLDVPVDNQRVSLDVGLCHLPVFRHSLMVFGVEKYDADGERLLGQHLPNVPPMLAQMASPSRVAHGNVGYNVYALFGILGRFMYGGLELHLVSVTAILWRLCCLYSSCCISLVCSEQKG